MCVPGAKNTTGLFQGLLNLLLNVKFTSQCEIPIFGITNNLHFYEKVDTALRDRAQMLSLEVARRILHNQTQKFVCPAISPHQPSLNTAIRYIIGTANFSHSKQNSWVFTCSFIFQLLMVFTISPV